MAEYKLKIEFTGNPAKPWDPLAAMWNINVTRQKEHIYHASHSSLLFLLNSAGKVIRAIENKEIGRNISSP
jgi:hypothetical protein